MAGTTSPQGIPNGNAPSFEIVRAQLQEMNLAAQQHKKQAELEMAELRKQMKETAERMKEAAEQQKKTEQEIEKLSRNVGGLNRSLGELIETLIAARLWEKFAAYPYNLSRAYQRVPVFDEGNRTLTDIDILLLDSEWVMAVEVKREPDKDDVDRHIKRMGLIRQYPPPATAGKKLLGAISGGVVNPDLRDYAYDAGFFVLELRGEAVDLLPPPDGFKPVEW